MLIDNALNANNLSNRKRFNSLGSQADWIKSSTKTVQSKHKILGLHLVRIATPHYHKNAFCLPVIGVEIDSRLIKANLTPNHVTNIINSHSNSKSTTPQNIDDHAVYLLNSSEVRLAIKAGAYDNPASWTRKLNNNLRGVIYSNPVSVNIRTLHLTEQQNAGVIGALAPRKYNRVSISMVGQEETMPYFSFTTTDNSFSFVFEDTLHQMELDYKNNNSGFKIEEAVVNYNRRQMKAFDLTMSGKSAAIGTSDLTTANDLMADSQSKRGAENNHTHVKGYINPEETVHKKSKANISNDNISLKKHRINHEINLNKPIDNDAKSHSLTDDDINLRPHAINKELDLRKNTDKYGNSATIIHDPHDKDSKDRDEDNSGIVAGPRESSQVNE